MIPILLPGGRVLVEEAQEGRVVAKIPYACRPLRPSIPAICGVDFDLVGLERKTPGQTGDVKSLWESHVSMPAIVFSETFNTLFDLDVPSFLRGDELILVVKNISPGRRQFACAWLVKDERRS